MEQLPRATAASGILASRGTCASCTSPGAVADDARDGGGRATPGAVAETAPDTGAEDPRIAQVRELLAHLESGDETETGRILGDIARTHDTGLFQDVGRLTRELHEALNAFRYDTRLTNLANVDIPDAKERLNYVITMTDQAATRTLSAVEESNPVCDELRSRAGEIGARWRRFMGRELEVAEFRRLCAQIGEFLPWVDASAARIGGNLSEVLMAQGFQDLTGQIIQRVIRLVEEVEQNLVNLVRISGQKLVPAAESPKPAGELEGPQIPGKRRADTVSGQDEVDSLLSSLGF
jgi:chemotaxis protein CheZ